MDKPQNVVTFVLLYPCIIYMYTCTNTRIPVRGLTYHFKVTKNIVSCSSHFHIILNKITFPKVSFLQILAHTTDNLETGF